MLCESFTVLYFEEIVPLKIRKRTSSRIYKKLGKYNDLLARFSGNEAEMMVWAKKEAEKETLLYNQRKEKVSVSFSPLARIPLEEERPFNVGYV